ncbi:hypothetical protein DFH07DRAFT_742527 [Mycena maculata]|uniref:Essential protein Yae1 N-terminal domain-containing protein n=1 Tax=Mycena maculata TaxID=230809 RepID=A0AAD7ND15_9AGAR|nr:hypothetical protein DFH07DRAFT_742527 [Mycena maculata]
MAEDFDLETLVHLEQTLYDSGYQGGFVHGRIHGLIEGRALGREKGFEMWEELAFYEGFALTWKAIYISQRRDDEFVVHHIRHLLDLISQFPRVNPSASDSASELDILKLSRQIQSRYRALCSTLGVKPANIRASGSPDVETPDSTDANADLSRLQAKQPVWKIDNPGQAMTF